VHQIAASPSAAGNSSSTYLAAATHADGEWRKKSISTSCVRGIQAIGDISTSMT
jgi:hypothetical protein